MTGCVRHTSQSVHLHYKCLLHVDHHEEVDTYETYFIEIIFFISYSCFYKVQSWPNLSSLGKTRGQCT